MDEQTPPPTPELTYEETPIISPETPPEPQPEPHQSFVETPPPIKKPNRIVGVFKGLLFFIILFVIGFVLSGYLRDLLSETTTTPSPTPVLSQQPLFTNESTDSGGVLLTTPEATATPKAYSVLNGLTRQAVTDVSFTLPASVLPPICDGSACGSQGTYLPGGTRFTIAARGTGQVLSDFRGKIISDAGGKPFTTSLTTIAGKPATEFTSMQTGSTIGGYAFSRMHGYMIEVTDTLSLEINHFSPSGITTDFAADEVVFASIVQSLTFGNIVKGSVLPVLTPTVVPTTPMN